MRRSSDELSIAIMSIRHILVASCLAVAWSSAPALAQTPDLLFAETTPVRLTISAPFSRVTRQPETSSEAYPASLVVAGAAPETLAAMVSPRGISRRRRDLCAFPPIRIELPTKPAATSLFKGQRRLKLVTHCRSDESFQKHVLLEYAAYRLLNVLSPISLRVRLASIDYAEPGSARPFISRLGFLIEDVDDAAKRNGLVEITSPSVAVRQLAARDAARFAVFAYMIGNLDWSMRASIAGETCCHNGKLLAPTKGAVANLIPLPYDFDQSGFVGTPYAEPPRQVRVRSVQVRHYRGFCVHNPQAQAAASEMLAARAAVLAELDAVPGLDAEVRARKSAYLAEFFDDIATPQKVEKNLLSSCVS